MAKSIPKEIKNSVLKIVDNFNEEHQTAFQMTFRGQFAYLAKVEKQQVGIANSFHQMMAQKMKLPLKQLEVQDAPIIETKLGRLKYGSQMNNWSFAVFRYSREIYDAEEFMFPGAAKLDGTIEGTLRAGLELY